MSLVIHAQTGIKLGERVAWKKIPYKSRKLMHPTKKWALKQKLQLIFFKDFCNPNIYGFIRKDYGVIIEE